MYTAHYGFERFASRSLNYQEDAEGNPGPALLSSVFPSIETYASPPGLSEAQIAAVNAARGNCPARIHDDTGFRYDHYNKATDEIITVYLHDYHHGPSREQSHLEFVP